MDDRIGQGATLPAAREACLARLAELHDQIAAIKAEIATADLDRQSRRGKADARWFHRAKTALRHKQREAAELSVHLSTLPGRKDALKDKLIEVARGDYDAAGWSRVMDEAHRRLQAGEVR